MTGARQNPSSLACWLSAALLAACSSSNTPTPPAGSGSFEREVFSNEVGTRSFKLYLPPSYTGSEAWPLLVNLHGCGSDADEEARWSRFNQLADDYQVLVAYPEQSPEANGSQCWNWFLPEHQTRDAGEPALIAGITRALMTRYAIDPTQVFVAGISAGGAMANIMAVTYPDLYAAAMIYAGCAYKGTTCTGGVAALPPEVSGELAYQAMGEFARVVPVVVMQGDQDPVVPFPNAEVVIGQYLASADWADDGENNGSLSRTPSATDTGQVPGGHPFEIDTYTDPSGCVLAQRWLVQGMGHAWSQGESTGSSRDQLLTDPFGPDLTTATLDFLLAHPMPPAGVACHQIDSPSARLSR